MNSEEDEFRRIEVEAKRRAARDEDDDTQVYKKPCIGKDPQCPCQDGDACHYKDCGNTKALPAAQPEQEPDRRALQAAGTHPAPCARHCEAKAFEIEIRWLKSMLYTTPPAAQPEQEPWRESASDYERGVIDGRQMQAQSSVDKAVNAMTQRPWQGLTDDDRFELAAAQHGWEDLLIAAGAKLKERNT
jgi:hypothetical protein